MRITEVECHPVRVPGASPPFVWGDGLLGSPSTGEAAVLRIRTDDGAEGVAMPPRRGSGVILADLLNRVLREELVGHDPLQREWLWHRMWELDRTEELPLSLLGLVDTALWDLAGRLADPPGRYGRLVAAVLVLLAYDPSRGAFKDPSCPIHPIYRELAHPTSRRLDPEA